MVQQLLSAFEALSSHRGCQPSVLGKALAAALVAAPSPAAAASSSAPTASSVAAPVAPPAVRPSGAQEISIDSKVVIRRGVHAGCSAKVLVVSDVLATVMLKDDSVATLPRRHVRLLNGEDVLPQVREGAGG